MKITTEKKREILLESFDVLKNNYSNNGSKLKEIIEMMFSIDVDLAVEMWEYLLNKHKQIVTGSRDAYGLTEGIIYSVEKSLGIGKISDIIVKNEFIKQSVFRESADVGLNCMDIIRYYLYSNNLNIANELFELVFKNKNNREYTFGGYLETFIDGIDSKTNLTQEAIQFILSWTDRVQNPEEKAKLNISILGL